MAKKDPEKRYREAMAFLTARENHERGTGRGAESFHLASMRELLSRLGNPEAVVPAIHIAGTKGKGSTAAVIEAICRESGYRTGLYTSPHLDRVEERFVIDGQPISEEEMTELLLEVRPHVEAIDGEPGIADPTYFEVTTAVAMLYFARQRVALAVLEVGMGGRLDSTNVCQPIVTIITSISLDHTRELGDTLAQIASEKAGILKAGVPLVSGVTEDAARQVIGEQARACNVAVWEIGRDFEVGNYQPAGPSDLQAMFDYQTSRAPLKSLSQLSLGLLGRHQAKNAAVALAAVDLLAAQGWDWDPATVRRGLAEVCCRGRVELISRNPVLVIDAAHNVASIQALLDTLADIEWEARRILVFASSNDKDLPGMLRLLIPQFDHIILTRYPDSSRAADPQRLAGYVEQLSGEQSDRLSQYHRVTWEVQEDPDRAWSIAGDLSGGEGAICVTGSFFIAAHMRRLAEQSSASPTSNAVPLSI